MSSVRSCFFAVVFVVDFFVVDFFGVAFFGVDFFVAALRVLEGMVRP
ncbi:hypothetical protein GCM10009867_11110 [Pedococcus aerophilus]|uniref:Uncharacterized protein n=1 Tax=Pedococcus aerophilus TaxID=436356 RepID=A0ABN3UI51_9MICO